MFKCGICNNVTSPRVACAKVVVATRQKYYPARQKVNPGYLSRAGKLIYPLRRSNRFMDRLDDPGGAGKEIAVEVMACPECAKKALDKVCVSGVVA